MFTQHIQEQMQGRQQSALLRERIVTDTSGANVLRLAGKDYINFSSNDYLAVAQDCFDSEQKGRFAPQRTGAMASPLVTGRASIHQELERTLLDWVNAPNHYDCMLFSSGFAANISVINTLFNCKSGNALLIQDKLNHASLLEGGKQSQGMGHCRQYRFKHNNLQHLQQLLNDKKTSDSRVLVASEGVFSMDGDAPDLQKMATLCQQHNSWLMLDDAHGIGVLGKDGAGSLAAQGVALDKVDVLVITFGKALGSQGAAVIADKSTIDYLVNFSREYIYSTHISPIQALLTLQNINTIQTQPWRQQRLNDNIALFRQQMANSGFDLLPSQSPIQPVLVGDEAQSLQLSQQLKQAGIWVNAMRYPTVSKGQARLRVTLTASHSAEQIQTLTNALVAASNNTSVGVEAS